MEEHNYALRPEAEFRNKSDTSSFCAVCKAEFEYYISGKKRYLKRYGLKLLGLEDSQYAATGDFVCPPCRNQFVRKRRQHTSNLTQPLKKKYIEHNDHNFAKPASFTPSQPVDTILTRSEDPFDKQSTSPRLPKRSVGKNSQKKASSNDVPKPENSRLEFKAPTIDLLKRSKYSRALREMYCSKNRAVKNAILNFCKNTICKEIAAFCRKPNNKSVFSGKFTTEKLKAFSWQSALCEAKSSMPMLTTVVSAMFPAADSTARRTVAGRRRHKRFACSFLGICLYLRRHLTIMKLDCLLN